AGAAPLAEAVVDGLPGAELPGQVAPAAAVGQGPEDAVDHLPVVLPLAAPLAVVREEVLELFPLGVREAVGRGGGGRGALLRGRSRHSYLLFSKRRSDSPDTA